MTQPLDIALRISKQGNGATEATRELREATGAATTLAEAAAKGRAEQDRWDASLQKLDGAGLDRVESDLKALVAEVEKAGGATAELQKKLGDVQATRANRQRLEELAETARDLGKSTTDTAKGLNAVGEAADKGAGAGRVLAEVLSGNVAAITQLGPVLKAAGAAMLANPLFTLGAAAATVILPALLSIKRGWDDAAESIRKAGERTREALDEAREAAAKRAENQIARDMEEIVAAAERARAAVDAVTQARIAQTDAEEAVAVAEINAREDLSPTQRANRVADVQREARRRRREAELQALGAADAEAAQKTAGARGVVRGTDGMVQRARREAEQVAARRPQVIREELDEATQAAGAASAEIARAASRGLPSGDAAARYDAANQRKTELAEELAKAEADYADRYKAAQDRIAYALEQQAEARKALAAAAQAELDARRNNQLRRETITTQGAAADRVAQIEAEARNREAARAAERQGALDLAGADAGNRAADYARRALTAPAARTNPEYRAAAEALQAAAQAAQTDGTTKDELRAIVDVMRRFQQVLAANQRYSATLMRDISTLQRQVNELKD